MLSNELLVKIEPRLKDLIRDRYRTNFSFEIGTWGDQILQAARISLYKTDRSGDDVKAIFNNNLEREIFFSMVKEELKESGTKLRFMTTLDRVLYRESKLLGGPKPDLVRYHNGVVVCDMMQLSGEDIRKLIEIEERKIQSGDPQPEFSELINILEGKVLTKKYFDINSVYSKSLGQLCEKILAGDISDWHRLRREGVSFFDWGINVRGIGDYITKQYILPYYRCSLENLPLQGGLGQFLKKFKIHTTGDQKFKNIRDFFINVYPEMEDSSHWHTSRWQRRNKLSKEEEKEYFKCRVDHMFKHRLNCKTKEDVISALNDDERLKQALIDEGLSHYIYHSGIEKGIGYKRPLYTLVKDLEGEIYCIEPWELKWKLPHGTFRNPDNTINEEEVGRYLLWVDQNYGLVLDKAKSNEATVGIPHYGQIKRNLSANKIRIIYTTAKQKAMERQAV